VNLTTQSVGIIANTFTCNMLQSRHRSVACSWRRHIFRQLTRKMAKFTALSRRLEINTRFLTFCKFCYNGWNQKRICYVEPCGWCCLTLGFIKSCRGGVVIGVRSTLSRENRSPNFFTRMSNSCAYLCNGLSATHGPVQFFCKGGGHVLLVKIITTVMTL
jgi:hypothetical protein